MSLVCTPSVRSVSVVSVLSLLLAASAVQAVDLPPGGSVALPGSPGTAGVVLDDQLTPFTIVDPLGFTWYSATLQSRVVRLTATGKLVFMYRIRDPQPGWNGLISAVGSTDFSGFATDVDYEIGPGDVSPSNAERDAAGKLINFIYGGGFIDSSHESKWMHIGTDAAYYTHGGTTTIKLNSGDTKVISTMRPIADSTAPVAAITAPLPLQCVCTPVSIFGTANDPESFDHYTLEYATAPGGPWMGILTGTTPVTDGLLGVWDAGTLSQGYYFIRLTVTNVVELSTSVTTIIYLDQQFDTADLRSPADGAVLGGTVCFDGSVNDGNGNCATYYTVEYMPSGGGVWNPVDPAMPVYPGPVYNDPLASWDTRTGIPDGDYNVRLTGTDACGHSRSATHTITIDNTPPTAIITNPLNCHLVEGSVIVRGTVSDVHLAGWVLQYTGGDAHGWVTIASGTAPVVDGVLGVWDTTGLRRCAYTLRLLATDQTALDCNGATHTQAEYLVSVYLGPVGRFDYDGDLDVDMDDFGMFQRCFSGPTIVAAPECLN